MTNHRPKQERRNPLTPKERMAIPRQVMPAQEPEVRVHCFAEVNLGLTAELAQQEAMRCLECKKPLCMEGCPVGVNIRVVVATASVSKISDANHARTVVKAVKPR